MFLRNFIKSVNPYANSIQKRAFGGICSEKDFRRILELERERAERNRHIFSLLVLDTKLINRNNSSMEKTIGKIICRIRKIDQIGWYDCERIGIFLPYTPFQGACELAEIICTSLRFPMLESACKVYAYPTER